MDEYYFLYHQEEESVYLDVIDKILNAHHLGNGEHFLYLEKEFMDKYEHTAKVVYLHYSCVAHFLAHSYLPLPHPEKQLNVIRDYLFQVETWNYYELVLFNNSMDFLPNDFVDLVYQRVKVKMKNLKKLRRYKNELFSLISNILVIRIQSRNVADSKHYWNELNLNLSTGPTRMYEKAMIIFFEELIKIMENPLEDREEMNQILGVFTLLGMEQKKTQCIQLLEEVEKTGAYLLQ